LALNAALEAVDKLSTASKAENTMRIKRGKWWIIFWLPRITPGPGKICPGNGDKLSPFLSDNFQEYPHY
jgi:hypothetical protein